MSFISYAQNFEDVMLWRALKHIENGFYIDVGAAWPDEHSVTYHFYLNGWHGINLEPNPSFINRYAKLRPRDINLQLAVSSEKGRSEFYFIEDTGLSSLDKEIANSHDNLGFIALTSEVIVTTLSEIFSEYCHNQDVHFLKVDIEGYEKQALLGNDWNRFRPWIVVVEATLPMSQVENHDEWEYILLEANYLFVYADGLNRFYVAQEHSELKVSFLYPPNVFDGFVLASQVYSEQSANEASARATEAEAKATMAEQSANEANIRATEAEAKVTMAEQSANEAWQHYYMIEGSTSWKITKPLRLLGKFVRWLVYGSYHWLTFSPTSRPRRVIKNLVLKIKNYINSNPHYKEKVMFLLSFFPSLERRFVAIKDTSCHDDLDSFIILEFQNFILFFAKGPFEDNRGIGRVTREYYSYLSKNALQIHQKIDIKNQIKPLIYFYTSIHWCPQRLPYNSIVMIHDVIPLVLEEYFPEISKTWRETYKLVAQQASKIVTISQSSAYDIIKYLEIPKDKVDIVYNGVSVLSINKNSKVELPSEKYFVYIGAYDKHKNLDIVLHAMSNEKLNDCHLVLIGNNMEVLRISKKLKIEKRVHCLGRLDDSDVGFVLTHAKGLVFPSLYEGFGLPPLEAALLNVPSICSKRPAMTELLEGSAIFVEPDNVQGWANAMNDLASNKDLKTEIGRKAYFKAREYEWMNSANKLLDSLNIEMKRLDNVKL